MNDTSEDIQWSDAARERYVQSAEELIAALRAHVALTIERSGRERELGPYFSSSESLEEAAEAFNESELDWCGSFPLSLSGEDLDEFDDEDDESDDVVGPRSVLSGFVRWDFTVTDEAAVIGAGRDAYRSLWPSGTDEDVVLAVPDIVRAAAEIVHVDEWAGLENAPGLDRRAEWWTFVWHDGESDASDEEDPFAIVRAT
ncbi:hypothetical protein [Kribbella sp. CA-293567]|uniref:hypothetical protein n=1 Tax=Kribbella sp. CA-293567 TaxID=3002436 RepID=UPI0022DDC31F|nr:hypothetical protein [Kribbella sp. CA-293567]WBQ04831.1 hypothetical protein OX958_33360 [Kribbella sp. CA-293567]